MGIELLLSAKTGNYIRGRAGKRFPVRLPCICFAIFDKLLDFKIQKKIIFRTSAIYCVYFIKIFLVEFSTVIYILCIPCSREQNFQSYRFLN